MGPSAIGAQPPPEDPEEEWLRQQEEEGDEPFCNCGSGHGIEETDWNQCDCCGKPIYDEEPETHNVQIEAPSRPLAKVASNAGLGLTGPEGKKP